MSRRVARSGFFPDRGDDCVTTQKTLIKADCWLFSNLLREGRFSVPWYQRYYDWKTNQVQELLLDIKEAVKEKRDCYFLGTVIFVEEEPGHWKINDGQQRMITFSLTCAALCRKFAHETSDSQREGMALRILFDLDQNMACSLDNAQSYTSRISPQRDDVVWYQQMIRGNAIGTNGTITSAWRIIDEFIASQKPEESEEYFDFLLQKLEIACLKVPPEVDPNAVYETINCRGKRLEDLDLIRNYIYSHFNADQDSERKDSVHENLENIHTFFSGRAGSERASQYMRCHLQSIFGFLRKDSFYRDVRKAIANQTQESSELAAEYVHRLTEKVADRKSLCLFAETIIASNPNPDFTRAFNIDCRKTNSKRNLVVFLQELRGYTVTQPLVFALLTAYLSETDNLQKKQVAEIVHKNLSRLTTFVLRTAFVAPKFEPSHFEAEFSDFAKKITWEEEIPDKKFAEFLLDCDRQNYSVLNDSNFRKAISEMNMRGGNKIKQLLMGINRHHQRGSQILNDRQLTVEHILPKSDRHWGSWEGFYEMDPSEWINRIGNLTLLGRGEDRPGDKGNANFTKKKEFYKDSTLIITRQLADCEEWSPKQIKRRQADMAKCAVKVWRFTP